MVDLNSFLKAGALSVPASHFTPSVQQSVLDAQIHGGDAQHAAFEALQKEFPSIYNNNTQSQSQNMNDSIQTPNSVSISAEEYNSLKAKSQLLENPDVINRLTNGGMTQQQTVSQAAPTTQVTAQQTQNDASTDPLAMFDTLLNNQQSMNSQPQSQSNPAQQQTRQQPNDNDFVLDLQRTALSNGINPSDLLSFAESIDASALVAMYKEVQRLNSQPQPQPVQPVQQQAQMPTTIVDKPIPSSVNMNYSAFGNVPRTKTIFD